MSGSVPNKDDVERWTVEQVAAWLQQVELSDCGEVSLRKSIDGHLLLKLREEDLVLWGRDISVRNSRQILKLVNQINSQQQPPVIPPRQIQPGQASGPSQDPPPFSQNRPPFNHNRPPFNQNRPPFNQNRPPFNQNRPPFNQNRPTFSQNRQPFDQNRPPFNQNRPPFDQNRPRFDQNRPPFGQNRPPFGQNQPRFGQNQPRFGQNRPPIIQNQQPFGQNPLSFRPPPVAPQLQLNSLRDSLPNDRNNNTSGEEHDVDDSVDDDDVDEDDYDSFDEDDFDIEPDTDATSFPQQHLQQNSSQLNDQQVVPTGENETDIYEKPLPRPANAGPPVPTVLIPRLPVPPPLNQGSNLRGSGLQFGGPGFPAHGGPPWLPLEGTGPRSSPQRDPEPVPATTANGSTLPCSPPNIPPPPVPGGGSGRPPMPIPGKDGGGGWRDSGIPGHTTTLNGQAEGGKGGKFKPPVQHTPSEKNDHDPHTYEEVDTPPPATNGPGNTLPNSLGADKPPPVLPPRNQGDQRDSDSKRNQSQRPPVPLPPQDNVADSTNPLPPPDHSQAHSTSGVPTVPPSRSNFSLRPASQLTSSVDGGHGIPPNQRLSAVTGRATPPGPANIRELPPPRETNTPPRNLPPGGLAVHQKVNLGDGESVILSPFLFSLIKLPYFHLISRPKSKNLLATAEEGVFLLRPSTRSKDPLTLSHRHKNRTYNINVRQRHDGLFALGSEKEKEQTFTTIEELISTHKREPIKLREGEQTFLTTSPSKDSEYYYIRDPTAGPPARR